MSKSQRLKGQRGELEARNWLRERGIGCSDRLLSQTRDGGHDLETDVGNVEVKRRNKLALYDWITAKDPMDADPRIVMCRGDNRRWLIVMDAEDAIHLLQLELEHKRSGLTTPPRDQRKEGT